jgi:hypothetical protein
MKLGKLLSPEYHFIVLSSEKKFKNYSQIKDENIVQVLQLQ